METVLHRACARMGRVAGIALASLGWLLLPISQADAWEPYPTPPPVEQPVDSGSVNVSNGQYIFTVQEVSIGQPEFGGLVYERTWFHTAWRDNLTGTINSSGSTYTVSIGRESETFTLAGGVFTHNQRMGATLTYSSTAQTYTYTDRDGAVALFGKALASTTPVNANEGRITSLTRPTGERLTFTYRTETVCVGSPCVNTLVVRLQSVGSNLGYQLRLNYSQDTAPTASQIPAWTSVTKVTGVDLGTLYCAPAADSCAGVPASWPSATYGGTATSQTVTDQMGRVTRYTLDGISRIIGVKRPSSATDNITVTYLGE